MNFAPSSLTENQALGYQNFSEDTQQYFSTARLDFAATQKIRLYASWLYQYDRASGVSLPNADPIASQQAQPDYLNTSINSPLTQYSHGLGYAAPNATYNVGADITLTPEIVATTRFGYFFDDYHDIGWPNQGVDLFFETPGVDASGTPLPGNCTPTCPLPTALALPAGASTAPYDSNYTLVNASKHWQFNQDVQFFKSGWWGTHNIKVGYQFNRLWNVIDQNGNLPLVNTYVGSASSGVSYGPATSFGGANCGLLTAEWGGCTGQYGYVTVQDFATILKNPSGKLVPAIDNNHALYAQDSWTIGHGLTFNLGLRVEKENLPAPPGIGIAGISSINFPWTDKIEPRLGVAWGSRDGKLKIFGSYGVVNDVMKLLLAQTSFGAQGYEQCTYPLGPDGTSAGFTNSDLASLVFNAGGRACPTGVSNVGANFSGGTVPTVLTDAGTGVQLIENVNYRPEEPVAPNVKPYRQHEYTAGVDYALGNVWALEVRYDRRRLDHVIEDASLADPNAFEIYTVVNPGQGVNRTIDGYANYLTSIGDAYGPGTAAFNADGSFGTCPTCPPIPQAVRNYDGVEVRLTKRMSNNWAGDFSYTWSSLWGNYTGLTTTDQTDGGVTGRNSPDTTRAFDEPFYYFKYNGKSANGPLPTDRPNTLKGDVYYNLHWMGMTSTIGLFQTAYEGSPVSSWADVGLGVGSPIEGTNIWGRGNFVNATIDSNGNVTLGNVYAKRTPWYTQTDLTLQHAIKVNKNNESQVLTLSATFTNLLNQHAVTAYWAGLNSDRSPSALFQYGIFGGAAFYQQVETGYNPQAAITA
ncbi:MAG: TonB-dependent receptor, partial [Candidatus Acidiferrales bacterium]